MNSIVSIDVQFTLPSSEEKGDNLVLEKRFDETNCETAQIGLAPGVEAVKPKGGDYSYSGMHDHGPLPLPKEGGDFAKLIGMVHEARKHSNSILTEIIQEQKKGEKKYTSKKDDAIYQSGANTQTKRQKTEGGQ